MFRITQRTIKEPGSIVTCKPGFFSSQIYETQYKAFRISDTGRTISQTMDADTAVKQALFDFTILMHYGYKKDSGGTYKRADGLGASQEILHNTDIEVQMALLVEGEGPCFL